MRRADFTGTRCQRTICRFAAIMFTVFTLLFCMNVSFASAADEAEDSCNPYDLLKKIREDDEIATKAMSMTVVEIIKKIQCDISQDDIKKIEKEPDEAEIIISQKDPACYARLQQAYSKGDEESREILIDSIASVMSTIMEEYGCEYSPEEIAKIIVHEENLKDKETNYMNCVFALHRLLSAEKMNKSKTGTYTMDLGALAKYIVPAGDALPTAVFASEEIEKSCCAVPGCNPAVSEEKWGFSFGIELSDEHGVILYGYPIGGPDCLIMVTPERDDPASFEACYKESEEETGPSNEGGEE